MASTLVDCPACESTVSRSAAACPRCGHPIRDDLAHGSVMRRSDGTGAAAASDTMGLLSMTFGIVAIGLAFVPFDISWLAIVLSLMAIIFGGVALARVGRGAASGRGMAIAGLLTGVLGLILFLFAFAYVLNNPNEF